MASSRAVHRAPKAARWCASPYLRRGRVAKQQEAGRILRKTPRDCLCARALERRTKPGDPVSNAHAVASICRGIGPNVRGPILRSPVHPRVCGEHWWDRLPACRFSGSSPRVWRTRFFRCIRPSLNRFIPTCETVPQFQKRHSGRTQRDVETIGFCRTGFQPVSLHPRTRGDNRNRGTPSKLKLCVEFYVEACTQIGKVSPDTHWRQPPNPGSQSWEGIGEPSFNEKGFPKYTVYGYVLL